MSTIIISLALLAVVFFAARSVWRQTKRGGCSGCSGCSGGHCTHKK